MLLHNSNYICNTQHALKTTDENYGWWESQTVVTNISERYSDETKKAVESFNPIYYPTEDHRN